MELVIAGAGLVCIAILVRLFKNNNKIKISDTHCHSINNVRYTSVDHEK